ncbi:hypothetical protein [Mechercharimyces sp. CAU 1602]|uniref:hypothetical protein n=1 Tax=Mechercharimyces sp. CAU 1602 TaxID=2973933 RepID=UPI0021614215|nr:hypothetical protein [Mechercharimyces sp. CAU 1602]MCS1352803.1 hypothetical protein [Mechercharimyces sp. CAU 1602]
MADRTFGVKANPETIEKAKQMIDISGLSTKEWFEYVLSILELEEAKKSPIGYREEIAELERHTHRTNQLFVHVIQRASFKQEETLEQIQKIKEQYTEIQTSLQNQISELKQINRDLNIRTTDAEEDKATAEQQLEEIRQGNSSLRELIDEYKSKIDTLTGLINQYKGLKDENDVLREKAKETESLSNQLKDLRKQKDHARAKALLRQEKSYQRKIQEIQEKHLEEITNILNRIDHDG